MARKNRNYTPNSDGESAKSDDTSNSNNSGIPGNAGKDSELHSGGGVETLNPESAKDGERTGNVTRTRPGRATGNSSSAREERKRKSTASSEKAAADLSVLIASAHWMLYKLTDVAEMDIDEDEAKKLGDAVNRVNELFEGSVLSPKMAALGNLAFVAGSIYVPRLIAVKNNRRKKKQMQIVAPERKQ